MISIPPTISFPFGKKDSELDHFCDWIEASVQFKVEELSQEILFDYLKEQFVGIDDNEGNRDDCFSYINSAWNILSSRLNSEILSSNIVIEGSWIKRLKIWNEAIPHSFCLMLSIGPLFSDWDDTFNNYSLQGSLFERFTVQSVRRYYFDWEYFHTGWTHYKSSLFKDEVPVLAAKLNEELHAHFHTLYANKEVKDAGLDIVWYKKFPDTRGGYPTYLAQCASGKHWAGKISEPIINQWQHIIDFKVTPTKAFAFPYHLNEMNFMIYSDKNIGLILDRYRLLSADFNGEWEDGGLEEDLLKWLQPKVDWLLGKS